MTKVIEGEFKKIKFKDDSLACDSPLEVFNYEVSRLSKMDDDLFPYEVEIANISCDLRVNDDSEHEADDMRFDPSDIAFTKWLGSKFFNYKAMDHYTMKALCIYWIRGDDEVDPDLLTKDIMGFKTYDDYKDDWIYEWNKDVPWVDEKPWTDTGDIYTNYDDTYKTNHDDNEREELFEVHEPPICTIQRFEMIKYSFGQGEEYVAIKEDEYDDLARTSNNACRMYQEIFRMIDEGWMVTRAELKEAEEKSNLKTLLLQMDDDDDDDDDDDEISNYVDLHMYMLGGGWKGQDLQGLLWWIIIEVCLQQNES
ncbi:hypothetical protein Tco_0444666 [Tanacetum coccineum]